MDDHRYIQKNRIQRAKNIISERGATGFLKELMSYAKYKLYYRLAPIIISIKKKNTFMYQGNRYSYFYHMHNLTWRNERAVEIPIALSLAKSGQGKRILEVGNVLSRYTHAEWEVIDKFERGAGVRNVDVVEFSKPGNYDLILSISTIEHVGFDDEPRNPQKIHLALDVLKNNLKEGGTLLVTCPVGYNPFLDKQIADEVLGFSAQNFLIRTGFTTWKEGGKEEALSKVFGTPYPTANAVFIGIYRH